MKFSKIVLFCLVLNFALLFLRDSTAASPGTITIGHVIDLSGPNGAIGRDYVTGLRTSFDAMNSAGGINGKRVQYLVMDDGGDSAKTPKLVTDLIERNKVDMLVGGIGDDAVWATLEAPAFKRSKLTVLAPLADIIHPRVTHWRPSTLQEVRYLLGYFEKLGIKQVGIAYQQSHLPVNALNELTSEIKRRGISVSGTVRLDADNAVTRLEAQKLAAAKPGFVVMIADTINSAVFVKAFRAADAKTFIAGTSLVDLSTLREIAGIGAVEWTVFSQVVPNPLGAKTPVQIEHATMMKKFRDEALSSMTLEGYLVGKTLAKTVFSGALRTVDLGGLVIQSDAAASSQSAYIDIALFKKGVGLIF